MSEKKFDSKKLKKLNNPQRLIDISIQYIVQKLALEHSKTWVEIGAGTGFFSIAFLKQYKPTTLYACDISETMIKWMEENIVSEYPAILPTKCEEVLTPLNDESADVVFTVCLHHELEKPQQTLAEAHRLLKPGGKLLIVDWKKVDMAEGPPTHIRYTTDDITTQLEKAGFKCLHISDELEKHFFVIAQK